jgi:S-DNA-T family DNA segregation ATPase FtsK/SpoIIIE
MGTRKKPKDQEAEKEEKREEPRIEFLKPAQKPRRRKEPKRSLGEPATGITAADNAPLPSLDILDDYDNSKGSVSREDLLARSDIIESKLADFGLRGEVKQVRPGPVVTTFEFVPAPGVRVSQIASRSDDLSLALAARAIRIQAPIPGKGAVGIEIPNPMPQNVYIKEMLEHYPGDSKGLVIALGKTVSGEPYYADISDMPHLLIAGATGSGKSVCINSIITSLLFNHTPATCRFILIDPKRLELITYKGIPHLLHPVITETRDVLKVMNWLTIEMDRRYRVLARFGVKNISSFNRMVEKDKPVSEETGEKIGKLPFYITIIDELADIMVSTGNEIYPSITRLSQMARAVGIHLVFATQRPSVDVVTGLIKANFPSRIAFQVTSKTDSRTILDVNGAEKLLGNGDMLYLPKDLPAPMRIQGSFISEKDALSVAEYWRAFDSDHERIDLSEVKAKSEVGDVDQDDELFEEAKELVIIHQQGSISLLQRRLRVGYARAARLIDMLEQAGVVGPFEGSKARKVLVTREEYERSQ